MTKFFIFPHCVEDQTSLSKDALDQIIALGGTTYKGNTIMVKNCDTKTVAYLLLLLLEVYWPWLYETSVFLLLLLFQIKHFELSHLALQS